MKNFKHDQLCEMLAEGYLMLCAAGTAQLRLCREASEEAVTEGRGEEEPDDAMFGMLYGLAVAVAVLTSPSAATEALAGATDEEGLSPLIQQGIGLLVTMSDMEEERNMLHSVLSEEDMQAMGDLVVGMVDSGDVEGALSFIKERAESVVSEKVDEFVRRISGDGSHGVRGGSDG